MSCGWVGGLAGRVACVSRSVLVLFVLYFKLIVVWTSGLVEGTSRVP